MAYSMLDTDVGQLCAAIRHEDISIVTFLLKAGADINQADRNGETALHAAVVYERADIVEELLQHYADPDVTNLNGQCPLHLAAGRGYVDIVRLLLEYKCDTDTITKYTGMTALHMASQNGHTSVVRVLVQHGADIDATDVINKMPIFYAANEEIRIILSRRQSENGNTPPLETYHYFSNTLLHLQEQSLNMEGQNKKGESVKRVRFEPVNQSVSYESDTLEQQNSYSVNNEAAEQQTNQSTAADENTENRKFNTQQNSDRMSEMLSKVSQKLRNVQMNSNTKGKDNSQPMSGQSTDTTMNTKRMGKESEATNAQIAKRNVNTTKGRPVGGMVRPTATGTGLGRQAGLIQHDGSAKNLDQKVEYSAEHKQRMQMNVFDRLTKRRK